MTDASLERMLTAWRDWRNGTGPNPLGFARAHAYAREENIFSTSSGYACRVPTLVGIATEIDRAFGRLRARHRIVLALEYLRPDLNLEAKAAMLGLSRRGYCRRLDMAKRLLAIRLRVQRNSRQSVAMSGNVRMIA